MENYHTCDDCGRYCYTGGTPYPDGYTCEDCEEEEEVRGVCDECGFEGKFIGKEGDNWTCSACLYGGGDSEEDELISAIDASGNALF